MSESRRHWAHIAEVGAERGVAFLFHCYRLGGKPLIAVFLLPAMIYYFITHRQARRASRLYLERLNRRLREPLKPLLWYSFRHFWSFAMASIDKFAVWRGQYSRADVDLENDHIIRELRARNQGAVCLISHLGNFEICRCLSTQHPDLKLTVLMHTKHTENFNRVFRRHVDDSHVEVLQVSEITPATAMLLAERLGRGELIAIAGDRIPVRDTYNSFRAPFLGHNAWWPKGPFILAAILRAPLLTVFCSKLDRRTSAAMGKRFRVRFDYLKADGVYPRRARDATLAQLADEYAQRLEQQCLQFPLQWFNFYDYWNLPTPTPSPAAIAPDERPSPSAAVAPVASPRGRGPQQTKAAADATENHPS